MAPIQNKIIRSHTSQSKSPLNRRHKNYIKSNTNLPTYTTDLPVSIPKSVSTLQMYTPLSPTPADEMRKRSFDRPSVSNWKPVSACPSSRLQLYRTLWSLLLWLQLRVTDSPGRMRADLGLTSAEKPAQNQTSHTSYKQTFTIFNSNYSVCSH